ncbi:MAG: ribonuclease P protein component [Cyanobacteria bacterium P01_D01_bin.73]
MALPKVHRIRDRHTFDKLRKHGIRRRSKTMTVWALKRSPQSKSSNNISDVSNAPAPPIPTQFGVAVSKKVHKRAVVRNRIRRRIHSAIVILRDRLEPNWYIRISARDAALECHYSQFLQELETILSEIEVIHGR